MGESRTELLAWINDLLQINYTKVEQLGTGAAHVQVIDSVFGDIPMNKVKFNSRHEYEYISNFKILQTSFNNHSIDKVIPVERLVKCRFQDNLEFLQWMKKFWDTYYPGGPYDAIGRRQGGAATPGPKHPPKAPSQKGSVVKRPPAAGRVSNAGSHPPSSVQKPKAPNGMHEKIVGELNQQITEFQATVEGLEKERDFYFGKLRDIEILLQQHLERHVADDEHSPEMLTLKQIQEILYSTEEGFEVPNDGQGVEEVLEDETF